MTRQAFNTIDVARLEVAIKPTTPYNLVPNPSGALGAWGWVTPDASYMTREPGAADVLNHVVDTGVTNARFMTEPMPITGGHYAAAAFVVPPPVVGSNAPVTYRIEWLTSAYASISLTTASNAAAEGTYSLAAVQAPSNAAFFRLHFTQASAGTARLTGVRAATSPTAAALVGDTLLNLVTNPSFEVDLSGWTAANSTLARTTVSASVGTASMQINNPIPSPQYNAATTDVAVEGGKDYTLSARFSPWASGGSPRLIITWLDGGGTPLDASGPATTAGTWTTFAITHTAPPGATMARLTVGHTNPSSGYTRVDAVAFHEGTSATYFDGTTAAAGTYSYAWTGAAHASTSKRTNTNLTGLAAVEWRNIIGPTHSIKTARESLNVGTLEAELLDANLDPATSSTLRPGGAVRLLVLVNGVWEPLFVGETDRLTVKYDDKRRPVRPPRVSLTAVDMTRRLASAQRTQGVGAIADLPHVLEGAGVPWNVNGSTAQLLASPTIVSVNDNATALDQIALTRDSTAAHAWVDRNGALVATTAAGNLLDGLNPSFESASAANWTFGGGTLTSTSASDAPDGGRVGVFVSNATAANYVSTGYATVTPGRTYTGAMHVKMQGAAANYQAILLWYSDTTYLGAKTAPTVLSTALSGVEYRRLLVSGVAPATANRVYLQIKPTTTLASGAGFNVDDAWIMRGGVLDDARYSDIEVAFSSEACINAVEVDALTLVPAATPTGGLYFTSEVVPYGPYERSTSIAQWGRRARKFTVHGLNAAQVSTLATAILDRNANPSVTVSSLTVPMRTAADLEDTLRDLGDIVQVSNAGRGIKPVLRVTSVEHSIESEPRKWLTTLGFTTSGSVASPTVAPDVQSAPGYADTAWTDISLANGWVNYSPPTSGFTVAQYRRLNGVVHLRGLISGNSRTSDLIWTAPVGFRHGKFSALWAQCSDTGTTRIDTDSAGNVMRNGGGVGFISLNGISYPADQ